MRRKYHTGFDIAESKRRRDPLFDVDYVLFTVGEHVARAVALGFDANAGYEHAIVAIASHMQRRPGIDDNLSYAEARDKAEVAVRLAVIQQSELEQLQLEQLPPPREAINLEAEP